MTALTEIVMDIGYNLAKRGLVTNAAYSMTGLTGTIPDEGSIPFNMETMLGQAVVMTILAADICPPQDNILNRSESCAHVGGSGRSVAIAATTLM